MVQASLVAAARALAVDDRATALARVVEAWRACPAEVLAELADRLGEHFATPAGLTEPAWHALAAAQDPRAVGGLRRLRALTLDEAYARIHAFDHWAPDPRLASAMLAVLEELPFTSNSSWSFWSAAFTFVLRLEDPRFTAFAERAHELWKGLRPAMHRQLGDALRNAVADFPTAPVLPAEARAVADRLLAALAPPASAVRTLEDLLADVYANPRDDAPRLVLADFLQEREDPRGEFIALQCRGAPLDKAARARERALLAAHAREWMGPLAPAVAKSGRNKPVFRRGFLASAYVTYKHPAEAERIGREPAWATVDELGLGKHAQLTEAMRHARTVWMTRDASIGSLFGEGEPWAIETLGLEHAHDDLLSTTRLPHLRVLRMEAMPSGLVDARIAAQLEEIVTSLSDASLKILLDAGRKCTRLRKLRFADRRGDRVFTFTREDGAFTNATVAGALTGLGHALARLRPRILRVSGAFGGADCESHATILEVARTNGVAEVDLRLSDGEVHRIGTWIPPVPPPAPAPPGVLDAPDSVAFAPSGHHLWVAVRQGARRFALPELTAGEVVGLPRMYRSRLIRGGDRLAVVGYCKVRIVDGETGVEEFSIASKGEVDDAAFSPDGTTIATGLHTGRVVLTQARTGAAPWKLVDSCADHVAFSPDGALLAVASRGGMLAVANLARHRTAWRAEPEPSALAFLSNEQLVVAVAKPRRGLASFAAATGEQLALHAHGSYAATLRVHAGRIFVGWGDGTVSAHDTSLAEIWSTAIGDPRWYCAIDVAPDGGTVAVVKETERRLVLLDAATGAIRHEH